MPGSTLLNQLKRLALPAVLIAVEVYEKAHGSKSGLSHLLAATGFASLAAAHTLHLNMEAQEAADERRAEAADHDRLFNEHLAAAVGTTIGDILRISKHSFKDLGERELARLADSAREAFKTILEETGPYKDLGDEDLPGVVELAVKGKFEPFGQIPMWRDILSRIAASCGITLGEADLGGAAEACRNRFIERFFDTIKSDFEHKGAAFASIHLRMMGELIVLARDNTRVTAKLAGSQAESNVKLDEILAIVSSRGQEIVAASQSNPDFPRIRKMASWLSRLDKRLDGIDDRLMMIDGRMQELSAGQNRQVGATRDGFANAQRSEKVAHALTQYRNAIVIALATIVVLGGIALSYYHLIDKVKKNNDDVIEISEGTRKLRKQFDELMSTQKSLLAALKKPAESPLPFPPEALALAEKAKASRDALVRAKALTVEGKYTDARKALQEAGQFVDVFDYLTATGDTHYVAGEYDEAVPWYERAFALPGKVEDPIARTNLALALQSARRGNIGEQIDRAIELHLGTLALQESKSREWAMTQNNLGIAWRKKPTGDLGKNIDKAIEAHNEALKVRTREKFPNEWAMTQNNLGNAWWKKPHGDRGENIDKAIAAYLAALEVRTREKFPDEWAMTQNNLGTAWWKKPTGDRGENIDKALEAYNKALEVHTREKFRVHWAMTQNNIGNAWLYKPTGARCENIDKAIDAYNHALEIYTREGFSVEWAMTQNNLGIAWNDKPTGDRGENIDKAIDAYNHALEIYTPTGFPLDRASTQNNLGIAWAGKPTGDRGENIDKAFAAYNDARQIYTRDSYPVGYASTQHGLGNAWRDKPTGDRGENIDKAIKAYNGALEIYTSKRLLVEWASTQNELGVALKDKPTGDRGENIDKAIKAYNGALEIYTRDCFPVDWAWTQSNLGNAWAEKPDGDIRENLKRAIDFYESALKVRTADCMPHDYSQTKADLDSAREKLRKLDSD